MSPPGNVPADREPPAGSRRRRPPAKSRSTNSGFAGERRIEMRKSVLGTVAAVTLAFAVVALALVVAGAAGGDGRGRDGHGSTHNGQTGYHFLFLDAVSGTADRLLI